jgi:hypothetical protein
MAGPQGINGTAVGVVLIGSLLAYSGLKGKKFSLVARDFIAGKNPADTATDAGSAINPTNLDPGSQNIASGPPLTQSTAANRAMIISALRSIGASNVTIAAFLGNFRVESGLSPTSHNDAEGAIGFANWEGDRRTALQNYARAHGMTETDPRAQVGYLIQELTTPGSRYQAAFNEAQGATNPTDAAAIIDQNFEGSSGADRAKRIMYAIQEYLSLTGGGGR